MRVKRKNRFYFYYRLIKWKVFQDRSPIGASIKITQRCNLRCSHCNWEKRTSEDLTLIEWKDVVDDLHRRGITVIALEGGEPTLYPEASDLVEYIKDKGMYCIFITNGIMDISHINPNVFWISIDGMEECHDRIRGKDTFKKAIKTVRDNQVKKLISLTSLSKSNVHDIKPICEYLSPILTGLMFNFTYPYSGIIEDSLTRGERQTIAEKIIKLKERYPNILNSNSYLRSVGREKKVHPWLLITVNSQGDYVQGCLVNHMEREDCSKCDMGCCCELSKTYELKRDTVKFWNVNFGLPRII